MKSVKNCGVFFNSLIDAKIAFFLINLLELVTHFINQFLPSKLLYEAK